MQPLQSSLSSYHYHCYCSNYDLLRFRCNNSLSAIVIKQTTRSYYVDNGDLFTTHFLFFLSSISFISHFFFPSFIVTSGKREKREATGSGIYPLSLWHVLLIIFLWVNLLLFRHFLLFHSIKVEWDNKSVRDQVADK